MNSGAIQVEKSGQSLRLEFEKRCDHNVSDGEIFRQEFCVDAFRVDDMRMSNRSIDGHSRISCKVGHLRGLRCWSLLVRVSGTTCNLVEREAYGSISVTDFGPHLRRFVCLVFVEM